MATLKTPMTPEKFKNFVMDLGKPTKRGVRKCPKCGVLNGTRGLTCKNKSCEYVFKEGHKKKGPCVDAIKIDTGSTVQVFSVRLRDRGPDYRGFVQLPVVQDLDGNPADNLDPAILASVLGSTAKCYVDTCSRANPTLAAQGIPSCVHIRAAIDYTEHSKPLNLKNSILNSMQVSDLTRQAIWDLATDTPGPLVQRVTKSIMVVKCKPDYKHPLGFLHLSFTSPNKMKHGASDLESKLYCCCKEFKCNSSCHGETSKNTERTDKSTSMVIQEGRLGCQVIMEESVADKDFSLASGHDIELPRRRCLHFYACVCSFASDAGLSKEFAPYIKLVNFADESALDPRDIHTATGLVSGENDVEFNLESDETNLDQSEQKHGIELQEMSQLQPHGTTDNGESLVIEALDTQDEFHVINQSEQIIHQTDHDVISVGGVMSRLSDVEDNLQSGDIDIEATKSSNDIMAFSASMTQHDVISHDIIAQNDMLGHDDVLIESTNDITGGCDVEFQDDNLQSVEVILDENQQIIAVNQASPEPTAKRLKFTGTTIEASDRLVQASSALLRLQQSNTTTDLTGEPTVLAVTHGAAGDMTLMGKRQIAKPAILRHTPKKQGPLEESGTDFSFLQWLCSVTERVNQTMHYQFSGIPDPLVFHAPQVFFDCLQARISAGSKKKRLPNHTTGFMRKDALPLGMFTKYTWYITNILHVKQIFDTPEVTVDITRNFVENRDGSFDFVERSAIDKDMAGSDGKNLPIRPFELKTYLKVGHTSPNQKEATPFIIEWIPDILPRSHIGELRIKFEYGHQRNGHLEDRSSLRS